MLLSSGNEENLEHFFFKIRTLLSGAFALCSIIKQLAPYYTYLKIIATL